MVKFESSVLCTVEAYIGHLGYFVPHLMNKKADYGFKILKRCISKTEKMRKCPKQPIFGMFLCIRKTKSVSAEFCRRCKVIFCSFFADEDGWEAEKLGNSVESGFFASKMLFFHQITNLFGGKCARNQTLDMKWIKIALEYCNLALISSLEQKTSNIQCHVSELS